MARACLKCGHENPDDVDFCQKCGEYVRWELSGVRQAVPAPPPAQAVPPAAPETPAAAAPPPPAAAPPPVAPAQPAPPPVEPAAAPPPELAPPPPVDGDGEPPPSGPTSEYESPQQAPEPDSVVLTLRHPEDESATGADVTGRVEAGGTTSLIALIRNQSGIVDNYDLLVEGLPDGWWTIAPSTVYLVPYGAPGGEYEQEVAVSLHPPRAAEAEARTWPMRIVAVSKANGTAAGQATAALDVSPYHELEAEMRPERASGRRKATFAIAVRNRANAPVDVQLAGVDPDNLMRFAFQKQRFTVEPGRRNGSGFIVKPPKPALVGRPVTRRFEINSTVIGSETGALPKGATLVQKPWIPFWALLILPLLLIAALAAFLLWPRTSTVPDLAGKEVIAAEQALADAGLTLGNQTQKANDKAKAGTILLQSPAAGDEVDDGSAVSIVIATSSGKATVPDVLGKTLEQANELVSKAGFSLAPPTPPPGETDIVASQIPLAGNLEPQTTPITLAFKPAPKKGDGTGGQGGGGNNGGKNGGGGGGGGVVVLPGKIEVPDLDGVPQKEAFSQVSKLGLVPKVGEEFSSEVKAGGLIHQKPEHGAKVGKGSTIVLVYSKGDAQVIYEQDGNLFVVSALAGGKPEPLTSSGSDGEPAISADGALVAFRRGNANEAQIWTMNPKNPLSAKPLTETGFNDNRPVFSPDGKTIAFVRSKPGPQERDLCFVPATGGKGACIPDANRSVTRPTWSPDGKVILVVASAATEKQTELLRYASNAPSSGKPGDWTDQGYVTDALHGQRADDRVFFAVFSPDGKQLALSANWGAAAAQVMLAAVKGGTIAKPRPVPNLRGCALAWRHDGLELAVAQAGAFCDDPGTPQIIRVDPKKPAEQNALHAGDNPTWTPAPLGTP